MVPAQTIYQKAWYSPPSRSRCDPGLWQEASDEKSKSCRLWNRVTGRVQVEDGIRQTPVFDAAIDSSKRNAWVTVAP